MANNTKIGKFGALRERVNKNKKLVVTIKKQVSAPTRSTMRIRQIQDTSVQAERRTKNSTNVLLDSTTSLTGLEQYSAESTDSRAQSRLLPTIPYRNAIVDKRRSVDRSDNADVMLPFNREKWISMSEIEKNGWINKYLSSTKNEVLSVYKMIIDSHKENVLQNELSELSSILSIVDIDLRDRPFNTNIQAKNNYLTMAIQLKESQEKYKEISVELDKYKKQLNKNHHNTETQTQGIRVEDLENNLKNVSIENIALHSKLNSSNTTIADLKRDLKIKNNELNTMSMQNLTLNLKIESLMKTIENVEKDNLEKTKKIENLFDEKNKLNVFKYDIIAISKEKDEAEEQIIELKNKLMKVNKKLLAIKSKTDKNRIDFVHHTLKVNEQIDELNEKNDKIKHMEEIISKYKDQIENLTQENQNQINTIEHLEANVVELKSKLNSWETRAECWINMNVRDKYESKIVTLNNEIKLLTIKNEQQAGTYKNLISENYEQMANKDKIVEMKQKIINQQERVIMLMKNLHKTTNSDDQSLKQIIDKVFSKYDKTKQHMQNSEELIKENGKLRELVNEFKQRLSSSVYKQLL